LLEQKETKIQDETPTPILFSHKKPSQYRRKICSSHRFAKTYRTITNVCITQILHLLLFLISIWSIHRNTKINIIFDHPQMQMLRIN
jgi:hypothetical protein